MVRTDRFDVIVAREAVLKGDQSTRVASQIGALQPEEAIDHQARSHKQYQSESDLTRRQRAPEALARQAHCGAPRGFLERFGKIGLRHLQGRNNAECEARRHGQCSRKCQHARVDADLT